MKSKYEAELVLTFHSDTGELIRIKQRKAKLKKHGALMLCDIVQDAYGELRDELDNELRKSRKS